MSVRVRGASRKAQKNVELCYTYTKTITPAARLSRVRKDRYACFKKTSSESVTVDCQNITRLSRLFGYFTLHRLVHKSLNRQQLIGSVREITMRRCFRFSSSQRSRSFSVPSTFSFSYREIKTARIFALFTV